jgi:uncharacterized repeat protein (TIGR01451 family)
MKSAINIRILAAAVLLLRAVTPVVAHNLDTRATGIFFAQDFLNTMSARASANQPLVQANDEFWMLLKTTPGPGTTTGVGGYQTFYVPDGMQVMDVAYVLPDLTDPRGFRSIPMKGQSPIATGNGSISPQTTPELTGWSLPGVNGLGIKHNPVSASGTDRGTLAGVYADTGVFYSTDPRTVYNSYGAAASGGTAPMSNNSGDTVGEYFASNVANSSVNGVFGTMNLWDSYQLRAYGRKDVSPIIDSDDGRGNAPWGLACAVAGPQSGYAWEFDYPTYQSTSGTNAQKMRAAIRIGPWQRIKYPGSQISSDQPGLIGNTLGYAGVDASLMGANPTLLPTGITAVRFAIGQLELGRPEYSAVKVRINNLSGNADDSFPMYAEAFGGDAGGTDGGKDHIWRYFDPTVVKLNVDVALQKVASKKLVAPGETFHFDLTFINSGKTALPNITLTDTIPTGLSFVSASPSASSVSGATYVWNLGTVTPKSVRTVRVYVKATGSGTVYNTVTARSGSSVVAVATDSVEIGTRAILIKSKSVTPSNSAPGNTVQYTMLVENIGTGTSGTPMIIRDFLPPGFTYQNFVSATLNGASISNPAITINASNPAQPVFTVGQGIQRDKSLVIRFNALIGAGVTPGTYYNVYEVEYEDKKLPPIPEAPVTVGGARIGDFVWRDWDNDGVQDAGEEGISGVTVQLFASNGTTLLQTKTTDSSGMYLFTGLNAGTYVVKVTPPAGHTQSFDPDSTVNHETTVVLTASQSFLTADFGYRPTGSGSIGDQVFEDRNKNGVWNAGEPGIPNVTVNLYEDSNGNGVLNSDDLLVATQATNGSGIYNFTGLNTTRSYIVQAATTDPDIAAYFTTTYGGSANQLTSTNPRAVASGFTTVTTADFGFWRALPAAIGDQVFIDTNQNGVYDAGDAPIGNVTVNLYEANGVTVVATTTTDPLGQYLFGNIAAGTYVVKVDTADSDIPSGYSAAVLSYNPTVTAGASFLTADFPFVSVFAKLVDKASALPGGTLNYTMYPYWPGPSLLSAATVTDPIPDGTTFVSATQGGVLSGITGAAGIPGSHPGSPGSGTATLTATKDTYLNADSVATNYGSGTTLVENRGGGNTLGTRQILVQFDLTGIPSGATITGSQFRLTKTDTNNSGVAFQIYPILKSWTENVASFNLRQTSTYWGGGTTSFDPLAPSADFGSLLAQTTVNGAGTYTWSAAALLSQVQSWYATPANNFGLVLGSNASGTDDTIWNSRENSGTKPQLVVDYTAPAIPSTTTSISVTPSPVFDSGAGVNVNVSMTVTASGAVSNISPTALTVIPGSNGATATRVSGPTGSPTSIGAGGGSAVFTWVYKVFKGTTEDQVRFSGAANGTGATFASATSNGVVVKDASIPASVVWNLGGNSAAANGSHAGNGASTGSVSLVTTGDVPIYQPNPTTNYASQTYLWTGGLNYLENSLMQFDLSTVPVGATIDSASLRLNKIGQYGTMGSVSAHRITAPWLESQATWNNRLTGTPWSTSGGSYNSTAEASLVMGANGVYNWSLTTLAQGWLNGSMANNGVLIRQVNQAVEGGSQFDSREATTVANRPRLNVDYTIPATPSTTTAISVLPALVTHTGSGVNVTVTQTVTATGAVSNITPPTNLTISGTNGANATKVSGPTGSGANIGAGGGSATFTWIYKVTAGSTPGQVTFAGTPTGTGATFAAATSNGVIVTQPLTMTVQINSPNPGVDFIENTAQFRDGPTFLAQDNAITGLGASIGDFVWADIDSDGVQDSGEPGIGGVTVNLYAADSVTLLESTVTDSSGSYHFYNLTAGNYVVRPVSGTLPSGHFGTTAASVAVSLASGQQFTAADFGFDTLPPGTGSIGDYVWIDADNDGVQDVGELPLVNASITLERRIAAVWTVVGTATTGNDGLYTFNGLSAGSYRVSVDPNSQIASPYASGTFNLEDAMNPTFDRDGIATPDVALVTLATNSTVVTNADFGFNWSGSIGDFVWWDDNLNGIQDETPDRVIYNARVQLYFDSNDDNRLSLFDGDYEILRVFTNVNGVYQINNLPPGRYIVDVYESSIQGAVVPTTTANLNVDLAGGQVVTTADFGYAVRARVEANVFHDVNSSGFNDGSETLLAGITVTLSGTDTLGNPVHRTATSNSSGNVVFLVPEGTYTISYDTAGAASLFPSLTSRTTPESFVFDAEAGDQGVRKFEFGLDDSGVIGDTVFADQNGNGSRQASEPGLSGVTVNLYSDADGNGTGDELLGTTVTDATGFYQFTGLANTSGASRYIVQALSTTLPAIYQTTPTAYPAGAVPATSSYSTALSGGQVIDIVDFGYPLVPAVYRTVSGTVYHDNGSGGGVASDGSLNGSEPGLAGTQVLVEVDTDANGTYENAYTIPVNAAGFYRVGGIPNGANVKITVLETTLPHSAFTQTGDPNGVPLSPLWTISSMTANATNINFGYIQNLGSIAGTVVLGNGNGLADIGEPALGGVTVTLRFAGDDTILGTSDDVVTQTTSAGNGSYGFTNLLPGSYELTTSVLSGNHALADADGGNTNSISVNLAPGQNLLARDFEQETSIISGVVWTDSDADGARESGEPLLSGVSVFLDSDNNGVQNGGEPMTTTNGSGFYQFTGLSSGSYAVRVTPATLPSGSLASYDLDGVSSLHLATVTVAANQNRTDVDFGYYRLGAITGTVWEDTDNDNIGDRPMEGVILTLVDGGGSPVLSGGNPVTTTTLANGTYSFTDLTPGSYGVVETQPGGFASLSDKDGGNPDEIRPIAVTSAATNGLNDFIEISRCPDTWADWKQLHPGETAAGNPDADAYDNFAEFAFAMPYNSGVSSEWLNGTAWIIRPSTIAPGTLEGVFIRPKGAPLNVTYTLQYSATPGNPTVWQNLVISLSNASTVDNGDCTETVTIHDLESITGLTAGTGVVRIQAVLDEDSGPGDVPDGDVDHVSLTEPEGWKETPFGLNCQTYNVPYLQETLFTGTIGAVSGQSVTFSTETDLSALLTPGAACFIEVTSGENEGHRFDIVSAGGQGFVLALDNDIHSAIAPFSTIAGALPANLTGDTIAVHRHRTLSGVFPATSFGAGGSQTTADQVQVFAGGAWTIYWLYDENDGNPATARWVDAADATMADRGATVIVPGQGMYFLNRTAPTSLLAYGEVRVNRFIRPLAAGSNLVGGGYPLDQSANGPRGRAMSLTTGFFGSRDFKTADSIFTWKADLNPLAPGYDSYFLLNGAPTLPSLKRWARVGDSSALARDTEVILFGNRSAFLRTKIAISTHSNPIPWSP